MLSRVTEKVLKREKNWGKYLYKGKYGNSLYAEPGFASRHIVKQNEKSLLSNCNKSKTEKLK